MNTQLRLLPDDLRRRADARWDELAWHPADIPAVIQAAKSANLMSLGGHLQIRTFSGYGESIYAYFHYNPESGRPWHQQVERSAAEALEFIQSFTGDNELLDIARESWPTLVEEAEVAEGGPMSALYFSWSFMSEAEATGRG
jgi:hypothetical protein